jgi:hypothetical protein
MENEVYNGTADVSAAGFQISAMTADTSAAFPNLPLFS